MFVNREEAGIRLAHLLIREKFKNAVIVAIPRGGFVVGKVISEILKTPIAILIVKKIGATHNPELAIGATGSDGIVFWDEKLIENLEISDKEREASLKNTIKTIRDREKGLGVRSLERNDLKGKTIIVVDDGVATGATAITASLILKELGSRKIVLATPVISRRTQKELGKYFTKIISVETPRDFQAVGEFYRDFPQVEDRQVRKLLEGTKSTRGIRS